MKLKLHPVLFIVCLLVACQAATYELPTEAKFPTATMMIVLSPSEAQPPPQGLAVPTTMGVPITVTSITNTATFTKALTPTETWTIASATRTHTPGPTYTLSPTITPTRCVLVAFAYTNEWRVNFENTNQLQTLLTESDLALMSIMIMDYAWEEGYCENAQQGFAFFDTCYAIVAEIQMTEEHIDEQIQRAEYLEAILATSQDFDSCTPKIIKITFHSTDITIDWEAGHMEIQNYYEAGERGLALYSHGIEMESAD